MAEEGRRAAREEGWEKGEREKRREWLEEGGREWEKGERKEWREWLEKEERKGGREREGREERREWLEEGGREGMAGERGISAGKGTEMLPKEGEGRDTDEGQEIYLKDDERR
ncbi:hypothetical protein Pcinc_042982 [Petrolisthes cinctipes]|nr:hypothetical protein Pcinc_042982 [Petrolisthes cinctipes]